MEGQDQSWGIIKGKRFPMNRDQIIIERENKRENKID